MFNNFSAVSPSFGARGGKRVFPTTGRNVPHGASNPEHDAGKQVRQAHAAEVQRKAAEKRAAKAEKVAKKKGGSSGTKFAGWIA